MDISRRRAIFLKQSLSSESQDRLHVFIILVHILNDEMIENELFLACLHNTLFYVIQHNNDVVNR